MRSLFRGSSDGLASDRWTSWASGLRSRDTTVHGSNSASTTSFTALPADCLERVLSFLPAVDVMSVARVCRQTRHVAARPRVWSHLITRTFLPEELPQDVSFLDACTTPQLRAAFRKLQLQRPAFLSDAPRTSDILEDEGARFRRVLHIDGRRDLNFTTCFTDVPPGDYAVLVRLQLQPGYVRGYCNFRAVFGRPSSSLAAKSTRKLAARRQAQARAAAKAAALGQPTTTEAATSPRRPLGWRVAALLAAAAAGKGKGLGLGLKRNGAQGDREGELRAEALERSVRGGVPRELRADLEANAMGPGLGPAELAPVLPVFPEAGAAEQQQQPQGQPAAAAAAGAAAFPEIEAVSGPLPQDIPAAAQPPPPPPPHAPHADHADAVQIQIQDDAVPRQQIQQAMGVGFRTLAHASVKRDAAYGASASGPRYVSRWLRPLWGSHDCAWHQLDPRGPLGEGAWRTLEMGSVTVRRLADVHLHQVMVQLRPAGAAQAAAAMPPGETRWRGVLVDYVELVPVKQCGLLEGLLPRCLAPRALAVPPAAAGQAPGAAVVHVPTL
ncbi:hypothetical protein HYH03_005066 [Edaphochlamys debaryana]|uniref:F-box domain-containing protein n=1 Tax=Edaphochlamys debaryana TaxID=47281 RepID=A0A835Y6F7_9CHLO|nr:hypothetical protein HYH03_005066 [Edaphochlamys debaryana]|eukprot:KAG2497070.1 hypothetical protein HYH03_005066 [Edaphochlamys debaryana]